MIKKLLVLFLFLVAGILFGCVNKEVTVHDDLLNYVNKEMQKAYDLENVSITAYENVSGVNYTDDFTMHQALTKEVVPNYRDFIDELEHADIATEELQVIHDGYVKGAKKQLEAFELFVTALEDQDINLVEEGNELLAEGRELINTYVVEIEELASEHNVEWE
ncbi:hypothetical protein OEV98_00350 [Caldibacillus lycopersici]|uniref:Lipoprotein n=1 Tax=Perspicuibacillus lycopersici TaxID=1325689 RepID=A0AAE3IRD6_9BACI|nr:hypothetical protein [Perspicuibacillus lycopersici]MCU9612006.1 hypothetical protein [Perspicuibacillus lycopersici]